MPCDNPNETLTPLWVTGIPAYSGTAIAEVIPGINSNSIPLSLRYIPSSPPLPNTNGSPP